MVWRFLFAILASLSLSVPALAKGPLRTVSVGNWSGGSFTNDRTGDFSHCAASATYRHGTNLYNLFQGNWLCERSKKKTG
jgi:hypothetical protein